MAPCLRGTMRTDRRRPCARHGSSDCYRDGVTRNATATGRRGREVRGGCSNSTPGTRCFHHVELLGCEAWIAYGKFFVKRISPRVARFIESGRNAATRFRFGAANRAAWESGAGRLSRVVLSRLVASCRVLPRLFSSCFVSSCRVYPLIDPHSPSAMCRKWKAKPAPSTPASQLP